jgi:hypothetical protein
MASARGDRKPCTHAECSGSMQFGRESVIQTSSTMTADGEYGWVCSEYAAHFQLASDHPRTEVAASSAVHASWDDDGAPTSGQHNADSPL